MFIIIIPGISINKYYFLFVAKIYIFFVISKCFGIFFSYDLKIVLFSFVFSAKITTFARKRQDNEIFHHTKL